MENKILKATHQGVLPIGKTSLPCAVLEDSTRVITQSAVFKAFGRTKRGRIKGEVRVPNMPAFIDANNLQPFINQELKEVLTPISYYNLKGKLMKGYKAQIIPMLCDVYLEARKKGNVLTKQQENLAEKSEILVRGFATIGIIALIDEATGYQEVRDRIALQKILDRYLLKEHAKWAKRFPDEFYQQIFRLNNWEYNPSGAKRPGVIGLHTNNIVYERLTKGILDELKRLNPKDDKGRRQSKHHQWLTDDIGHPKLQEHLNGVIALMKAASNWRNFIRLLERVYPKEGHTIPMNFQEEIE